LNSSLYYYLYSNLQSLNLVSNGNGSLPAYEVTVSDEHAKGVDFEARWQATTALRRADPGRRSRGQEGIPSVNRTHCHGSHGRISVAIRMDPVAAELLAKSSVRIHQNRVIVDVPNFLRTTKLAQPGI
jgi:hypothetical protein